jgi:hypothetical protein
MKTPFESMMTESDRKLVTRWTIGAAAFYGIIVAATVALVSIGINANGSANSEESMTKAEIEGYAVSVVQPGPSGQLGPSAEVTTGYSNATPGESVNPEYAAPRPIPEVDEMGETPVTPQEALVENGWDFNAPNGVPGFAPLHAGSAHSSALPHLTARTNK